MNLEFNPKVLDYLIDKNEMTRREFCRKFDLSYAKYQHWIMSPSTMKVDDLIAVCAFFKVKPSVFLTEPKEGLMDAKDFDIADSNDLMMKYIKENKNEAVNYERKISTILISHQKDIATLNESHLQEISNLKIEWASEKKDLEHEISRLKKALFDKNNSSGEVLNAAEDKDEYNKTKK